MQAIPLNPNTTGSEFAAVVEMMPIADQRLIEAKVREILEDRRLSSAGAVIGIPIAAGDTCPPAEALTGFELAPRYCDGLLEAGDT